MKRKEAGISAGRVSGRSFWQARLRIAQNPPAPQAAYPTSPFALFQKEAAADRKSVGAEWYQLKAEQASDNWHGHRQFAWEMQ